MGVPIWNFDKKTIGTDRKVDKNVTGNPMGNKIRSEIWSEIRSDRISDGKSDRRIPIGDEYQLEMAVIINKARAY